MKNPLWRRPNELAFCHAENGLKEVRIPSSIFLTAAIILRLAALELWWYGKAPDFISRATRPWSTIRHLAIQSTRHGRFDHNRTRMLLASITQKHGGLLTSIKMCI